MGQFTLAWCASSASSWHCSGSLTGRHPHPLGNWLVLFVLLGEDPLTRKVLRVDIAIGKAFLLKRVIKLLSLII